ncbi:hypothetical protein KKE60_04635 [Patescibacteria group bacterium]|nr:hypothetical protein [Patescibacteria group bacterium]
MPNQVITNNEGNYVMANLEPGLYKVSIGNFSENVMVKEGQNEFNIDLSYGAGAATIDEFKVRYDYPYLDTVLTITNHTPQTFKDQSGPNARYYVGAGQEGAIYPGASWDDIIGALWQAGPQGHLGDMSPGTHSYESSIDVSDRPSWAPYRYTIYGKRGIVSTWFTAVDYGPPIRTLANLEVAHEGIFYTTWQIWTPTNWIPPEPPNGNGNGNDD